METEEEDARGRKLKGSHFKTKVLLRKNQEIDPTHQAHVSGARILEGVLSDANVMGNSQIFIHTF